MIGEKIFPSAIGAGREGSLFLAVLGIFLLAGPAFGQDGQKTAEPEQQRQQSPVPSNGTGQDDPHAGHTMAGMNMPGMNMPETKSTSPYHPGLGDGAEPQPVPDLQRSLGKADP